MSVRYGLMALLERTPMYGYQLRHEFEQSTGSTWPLNVGQVYTTLSRLERDGMVEPAGESDDAGKMVYRLTDAGRADLAGWFMTPLVSGGRPRDELAIKVALALVTPGVDAGAVVRAQRSETLRHLQELAELRSTADATNDIAWLLVVESMIFRAEAEARWLDHCESRLAQTDFRSGVHGG